MSNLTCFFGFFSLLLRKIFVVIRPDILCVFRFAVFIKKSSNKDYLQFIGNGFAVFVTMILVNILI